MAGRADRVFPVGPPGRAADDGNADDQYAARRQQGSRPAQRRALVGHVFEDMVERDAVEGRAQVGQAALAHQHAPVAVNVGGDERVDALDVGVMHMLEVTQQPAAAAADIEDAGGGVGDMAKIQPDQRPRLQPASCRPRLQDPAPERRRRAEQRVFHRAGGLVRIRYRMARCILRIGLVRVVECAVIVRDVVRIRGDLHAAAAAALPVLEAFAQPEHHFPGLETIEIVAAANPAGGRRGARHLSRRGQALAADGRRRAASCRLRWGRRRARRRGRLWPYRLAVRQGRARRQPDVARSARHKADRPPFCAIGAAMLTDLPNMLTLSRIAASRCWWCWWRCARPLADLGACVVFGLAAITDYFDGKLARDRAQTSDLGRMLDPIADKLLVGAALMMLVGQTG